MKYYTYFPGCSASDGGAKAYNWSAQAVCKALDIDLVELDDWNCCGSTPSGSVDELGAFCMAARDLSLAEKRGLDFITPCSACYVIFNRTNSYLKQYPQLKAKVDEALAAGEMEYKGTVKIRHMLDAIVERRSTPDVTIEDAEAVARLLEAEQQSLQTGLPVRFRR